MAFYQPQSAVEQIKRHPKYYLNGGDVHFLVENYIYRVHRYFFERESAWFREKLGAPSPAGQQPKGSSDANPFPLDDVAADDFSKFLWVFYNPKYSIYDATLDDWVAILKLAFDWRFGEVKKLCTREIEKFEIAPVPKIELYQTYELDKKLLIPAFLYLCMRQEPLSLKEGRQIGLETALLVATARECARGKPIGNGSRSPTAAELEEDDMVSIIKEIFGLSAGPPSPSLTPLERGTGVATFTGTTPTPITSPRKQLEPARQPPPPAEVVSLKATNSQSQSLPTTKEPSPPPTSVPSILKPTPPGNASTNTVRSPPPMSTWGSNVGTLLGSAVNDFLGTSASPTAVPPTPNTTAPSGTTTNPTTATATGQSSVPSSAPKYSNRLMALFDSQGTSSVPEPTPATPANDKASADPLSKVQSADAKGDEGAETGDEGVVGAGARKKKSKRGGKA
ncbi:hypothetical protein L227DRAFT_230802 [Lentinus tigrinus ALCF2SS1-6]|uniref:BTB domain-containing protein n=1 Tax=Lentinus tigrinus ALCF2SS1-6 TaxID=1328759 RepID=A0A5C2S3K9_9APHY|nr:hypothetical protein L227DRAFT_230802 [Lentinus tigrinus ALCF2SS1-6]